MDHVAKTGVTHEAKGTEDPIWGPWLPERLSWGNVDWAVLGWMVAMHAGAIAAPFYFNWQSVGVAYFLYWLTASVGICLGYHRFLSHKSMKLVAPVRFLTTLAGVLSGEGSPINWSATHRLHHQRSDQEGDPHSPLITAIWSHLTWLFVHHSKEQRTALYKKYAPDLLNDPMLVFFEHTYFLWLLASGAVLWAIGGMPMLLWGLCMRMVFAYHGTWFVNSATHLWGYRNYDTRDESRNLWWVAIWAWGEGWHNNHHAHPHVAPAGHRWWELDPTWWVIKTLRFLGLAYDVDDRIPAVEDRAPAAADA
jgi:stearoyl-CoA desaturase (delta-9 desaturase)